MGCTILKVSPDSDHALFREDFSSVVWDLLWKVNVPNLNGLGQLGVKKGQSQCHHSIERIRLPI